MPRVFVIFRTFDRIWTCKTLTRELSPFEMDMSRGPIKFVFTVDHITSVPSVNGSPNQSFESNTRTCGSSTKDIEAFYCDPHERLSPSIVCQSKTECAFVSPNQDASPRGLVRRFSMPSDIHELPGDQFRQNTVAIGEDTSNTIIYFVLPTFRCTLLLDAHVASCVQCEYSRSKNFRRYLMRFLRRGGAFRNCIPDYEKWSEEEKESWEHFLLLPYLIDVVAVWPKQKIDYAWSLYVLGNLNKHVMLEEGFAWLSTLGGAHSSLGETFLHHAQRAGEISGHQLRLALQLGNESLIARCCVFWSWSLMQRGYLKKCKACILNTWRFCKSLKCRDKVLENMCKAVWSRLRYRRALIRGLPVPRHSNGCASRLVEFRDDSSDSETDCDKVEQSFSLSAQRTSSQVKVEKKVVADYPQTCKEIANLSHLAVSLERKKFSSPRMKPLRPAVKVW